MDFRNTQVCPLCGKAIDRVVLRSENFLILRCAYCDLAATAPFSYVSMAQYSSAPQYADSYSLQEEKFRNYARGFLMWTQRFKASGRLLDVGCSIGLLVDEARRVGYDAEGIDLDINAVEYARRKGRAVSLRSLEDLESGVYDVICLSHCLEHTSDPRSMLRACAALLREGGGLVLAVPCFKSLVPWVYRTTWYGWVPTQHYFHYSPNAINTLFRKLDLEPVGTWQESMDHRPPLWNMRRRDIPNALLRYAIAYVGGAIGLGDQLIGIARKPVSAC
jgi:SAM-dependent methyltransferase